MVVFLLIQIPGLLESLALISDMFQVIVELHLAGKDEPNQNDNTQYYDNDRVTVVRIVINLVD